MTFGLQYLAGNPSQLQLCNFFSNDVNIFHGPVEKIIHWLNAFQHACKGSDLHTYSFFKIRRIEILNIEEIGPPVFFTGGVGNKLIGKRPIS